MCEHCPTGATAHSLSTRRLERRAAGGGGARGHATARLRVLRPSPDRPGHPTGCRHRWQRRWRPSMGAITQRTSKPSIVWRATAAASAQADATLAAQSQAPCRSLLQVLVWRAERASSEQAANRMRMYGSCGQSGAPCKPHAHACAAMPLLAPPRAQPRAFAACLMVDSSHVICDASVDRCSAGAGEAGALRLAR